MSKCRIAMVQFESEISDEDSNLNNAQRIIQRASQKECNLIVFPEMFTLGYDLQVIGQQLPGIVSKSRAISKLRDWAREYNINIVAPMPLPSRMPGLVENGAVVISRTGTIAGRYSKIQLTHEEKRYFVPGHRCATFRLDFGTIGIMICYDAGFPEIARQLAFAGAELIIVPAAFPLRDKYMWDIYFQSRALENSCFVVAVNRVGNDAGETLFGNNLLCAPDGTRLISGPLSQADIQFADIDLNDVADTRRIVHYLHDVGHYEYQPHGLWKEI